MADNETIADIIAEMRDWLGDANSYDLRSLADRLEAAWKRGKAEAEANALAVGGLVEASRNRELSKTRETDNSGTAVCTNDNNGNAAKLREALKNLVDVIDRCDSGSPLWWHGGAKGVMPLKNAKVALAEPVRNCDRFGTADDAIAEFADEGLYEEWEALRANKDRDMLAEELYYFINWLFAPATEQEGDAK